MSTVFYIVPLLTGWKEERQKLNVPLVENYIDDSVSCSFVLITPVSVVFPVKLFHLVEIKISNGDLFFSAHKC